MSRVTDVNAIFMDAVWFNTSISEWDVSKVTNMQAMFAHSKKFNGMHSISECVQDMEAMFYHSDKFNTDISEWDVSRPTI